jgi:hypothetical protein
MKFMMAQNFLNDVVEFVAIKGYEHLGEDFT